jgi:sporulation protein YlmC with PRC-barrel domain
MLGLEEVIGLELISADARVIGTVEGVGIDLAGWKVRALRVGLRRGMEELIGRKRRYFAVDKVYIRTSELEAVSDAIIMRRPISAIGEIVQPEDEGLTPAGAFMGMRVICCNLPLLSGSPHLLSKSLCLLSGSPHLLSKSLCLLSENLPLLSGSPHLLSKSLRPLSESPPP